MRSGGCALRWKIINNRTFPVSTTALRLSQLGFCGCDNYYDLKQLGNLERKSSFHLTGCSQLLLGDIVEAQDREDLQQGRNSKQKLQKMLLTSLLSMAHARLIFLYNLDHLPGTGTTDIHQDSDFQTCLKARLVEAILLLRCPLTTLGCVKLWLKLTWSPSFCCCIVVPVSFTQVVTAEL